MNALNVLRLLMDFKLVHNSKPTRPDNLAGWESQRADAFAAAKQAAHGWSIGQRATPDEKSFHDSVEGWLWVSNNGIEAAASAIDIGKLRRWQHVLETEHATRRSWTGTKTQVAKRLNMSPKTLERRIANGDFEAVKLHGYQWRITISSGVQE